MIILIISVFVVGYLAIAFEHKIHINKAATAILTGVVCWTIYALLGSDSHELMHHLSEHLGEISGILFFLLGAMTIVELIDAHDGFQIIVDRVQTNDKNKLIWLVSLLSFFLSAVLDNLATTIVMISFIRKLVGEPKERWLFAGLIIIAANAGGAWSPIGDVSTTMLWIGNQISAFNIIKNTFLPSLVCMAIPTIIISRMMKGSIIRPELYNKKEKLTTTPFQRTAVFLVGVGCLLFVPVFKTITHLPPYMGILFGLGIMWVVTEIIHSEKDDEEKGLLSVNHALKKIDTPSILFFLGILLSVAALETTGILNTLSVAMSSTINNLYTINISIGLLSAIVDNVPLVAAIQGMYGLDVYPTDHYFWEFLAYCAGTGGSCLIIGSAAGVAAMGLEKINFIWYLKKISWLALVGYLSGAAVYIIEQIFF